MNKTSNSIYLYTGNNNKIETIEKLLISGNSYFSKITSLPRDILNHRFYNIIDVWVDQLSKHDNDIANDIINSKSKLGALLYLSNFGYTLSPFNKYPNNLNETMFNLSAEINIPMYLPAYIGALVYAIESGDTNFTEQKIKDFFTIGAGKTLDSSGVFIFADIYDIKNYLSKKDKETFKTAFDEFYSHTSQSVNFLYDNIFAEIQKLYNNIKDKTSIEKEKLYRSYLKPDNNEYYSNIIQPLIQRTNILNLSEITFDMNPVVPTHIGYQSLKSLNDKTNLKNINTNYFTQFFSKLLVEITTEENRIKELKKEQEKSGNDKDIVTETYYSFKNINDKWLSSPNYTNIEGYPFNEPNKSLINSFVFVDRAMNPIGDTILNAECLIDMFDDPNVSVFTALSQLLSLNGFEFFPLQNFMSYGEGAWRDTFKIDTSGNIKSSPAYVCMYIGGTSSYPSTGGNGFINDGIIDLSTADSKDFNTVKPNKNALSDDENAYPEFPFRQVRAFKVRFGEQNQSMFTDIKIESKEYPDTNESIQILSRLAGDNNNVPVPKGQNLYNLYENRAYRATITGLGNAMIQPTQYFQLENVPIFNGAYIILSVEHTIEPNKMMTNFSGTKILRYPVPRVVDAASIYGFEGSSAGDVVSHVTPGTTGTGTEAITISQPRLEKLKSVFGIDVSYAQINLNWNKYKGDSTDPGFPNPKFVLIKVSQGDFVDPVRIKNINGAKSINLKIGYYHYAEQYADSNVSANIVANATAQAQFFINTVKALPVPNFPLILDMEDREEKNKYWSKIKDNNDLWIDTFITELKKNGYNTILYANHNFITNKMNGNKFASIPLWHARYLLPPLSPESYNPNPSNGWKDWTIWQFSSSNNHLDLNIMKESFFESAKPYLNST
jgi:GH25 family lysozyme M1 (1,4-beta-N-acetylmuramidase)